MNVIYLEYDNETTGQAAGIGAPRPAHDGAGCAWVICEDAAEYYEEEGA
jgi:hypothetical protein